MDACSPPKWYKTKIRGIPAEDSKRAKNDESQAVQSLKTTSGATSRYSLEGIYTLAWYKTTWKEIVEPNLLCFFSSQHINPNSHEGFFFVLLAIHATNNKCKPDFPYFQKYSSNPMWAKYFFAKKSPWPTQSEGMGRTTDLRLARKEGYTNIRCGSVSVLQRFGLALNLNVLWWWMVCAKHPKQDWDLHFVRVRTLRVEEADEDCP